MTEDLSNPTRGETHTLTLLGLMSEPSLPVLVFNTTPESYRPAVAHREEHECVVYLTIKLLMLTGQIKGYCSTMTWVVPVIHILRGQITERSFTCWTFVFQPPERSPSSLVVWIPLLLFPASASGLTRMGIMSGWASSPGMGKDLVLVCGIIRPLSVKPVLVLNPP